MLHEVAGQGFTCAVAPVARAVVVAGLGLAVLISPLKVDKAPGATVQVQAIGVIAKAHGGQQVGHQGVGVAACIMYASQLRLQTGLLYERDGQQLPVGQDTRMIIATASSYGLMLVEPRELYHAALQALGITVQSL